MNQNLIDAIVAITGQEEAYVQEKISTFAVDDVYALMDMVRKNEVDEIKARFEPVTEAVSKPSSFDVIVKVDGEGNKDGLLDWLDDHSITYAFRPNDVIVIKSPSQAKEIQIKQGIDALDKADSIKILNDSMKPTKTTGNLPKPRDPMAKALSLGQYQPKVEPSKKEKLEKRERKHKGKFAETIDMSDIDAPILEEGVLGMTQMDSMLPRLLQLAGCPAGEEVPSPLVSIDTTSNPDAVTMSIDTDFDSVPQLEYDPEVETTLPLEVTADEPLVSGSVTTNIQVIRDAFASIESNVAEIKVGEFAEVRSMLSDLMSKIDRMGNNITGK
jgi:hypothetical protein